MSFNVSNFKSDIVSTKNFLRPTHFDVLIFPPVSGPAGPRELTLRTESVALPGGSFMTIDNYRPYASGKNYTIPYATNVQEVSMTHTIDAKADVYRTLYMWMDLIVDFDGDRKYTAEYYNNYVTDILITAYDMEGAPAKTIVLYEAFPISMDQPQMSWNTIDDIARLNVQYKFSDYNVQ